MGTEFSEISRSVHCEVVFLRQFGSMLIVICRRSLEYERNGDSYDGKNEVKRLAAVSHEADLNQPTVEPDL